MDLRLYYKLAFYHNFYYFETIVKYHMKNVITFISFLVGEENNYLQYNLNLILYFVSEWFSKYAFMLTTY